MQLEEPIGGYRLFHARVAEVIAWGKVGVVAGARVGRDPHQTAFVISGKRAVAIQTLGDDDVVQDTFLSSHNTLSFTFLRCGE